MFDIHPQIYIQIYYHLILIIVIITIILLYSGIYINKDYPYVSMLFALFLLFFIGLRPIYGSGIGVYLGDTFNYRNGFDAIANGGYQEEWDDPLFGIFTEFCAKHLDSQTYFFLLASLYIFPMYIACRKFNSNYTYIILLMIVVSFLFWSSGVNGIRAGIGSSFLLLGFSYRGKWISKLFLFLIAIGFHRSMLLPVGGYIVSAVYQNYRFYVFIWFISILLSQLFAGFWEGFFASFALGDDRFSSYLTSELDPNVFSRIGFRWDFLVYSAFPIIAGIIYINKLNYRDSNYIHLFNTYLVSNSFWILVIRSNFSNRFAALSWFLLPVILIVPLVDNKTLHERVGLISLYLLISYAFTYYMAFELLWR